ncbi:MAG TPA: periplasmic heavy metal sensor [Desulfobacteraceae bacterium]|nr:periplasmic heavy metal sensor [Desulfobacteraceae bacterium]
MKKTLLIGALIMVLASATFAVAGPYGKKPGFQPGTGPYAWNNLNLTTEQAEKLMALRQSNFAEMQGIRNELFQKRAELRLAWMQVDPDADKIKSIQKEINELTSQKQENMVDHRLAVRNILTSDQLTRYLSQCGWSGKDRRSPGMFKRGFKSKGMNRWSGPGAQYGPGMWTNPPAVQ